MGGAFDAADDVADAAAWGCACLPSGCCSSWCAAMVDFAARDKDACRLLVGVESLLDDALPL